PHCTTTTNRQTVLWPAPGGIPRMAFFDRFTSGGALSAEQLQAKLAPYVNREGITAKAKALRVGIVEEITDPKKLNVLVDAVYESVPRPMRLVAPKWVARRIILKLAVRIKASAEPTAEELAADDASLPAGDVAEVTEAPPAVPAARPAQPGFFKRMFT